MRRALLYFQIAFFSIGLACGGYYLTHWYRSRSYERQQIEMLKRELPPATGEALPEPDNAPVLPAPPDLDPNAVGLIEIPRLNLVAVVRAGEDDRTLSEAVGWLKDTAMPWTPDGNVGLAAHRDTFFRPIRHIKQNDQILLATRRGTYRYLVESTSIVRPEDVSVLAPVGHSVLTLVTCYPFYFIGHAPKRFIVRARLATGPPPPEDYVILRSASSASNGASAPPASYSRRSSATPARESAVRSAQLSVQSPGRPRVTRPTVR